jgi:hypothetical protein
MAIYAEKKTDPAKWIASCPTPKSLLFVIHTRMDCKE